MGVFNIRAMGLLIGRMTSNSIWPNYPDLSGRPTCDVTGIMACKVMRWESPYMEINGNHGDALLIVCPNSYVPRECCPGWGRKKNMSRKNDSFCDRTMAGKESDHQLQNAFKIGHSWLFVRNQRFSYMVWVPLKKKSAPAQRGWRKPAMSLYHFVFCF